MSELSKNKKFAPASVVAQRCCHVYTANIEATATKVFM